MKVAFDHQIFSLQRFGGVSTYFHNIFEQLKNSHSIDYEIFLRYSYNSIHLDNVKLNGPISIIKKDFFGKKILLERINRANSQNKIKESKFDIFHPTYYNTYFLKRLSKPFVLTVHDMTHEKFPKLFKKKRDFTLNHKPKAIEKANKIIAISEYTKKDLMESYLVPEHKIEVIYHGIKSEFEIETIPRLPEKYFLFVGQRFGYKNFHIALEALLLIKNNHFKLICTGTPFSKEEQKLISKMGLANRVFHTFVNEAQLNFLYKNAISLIYPSLYEGFGYPILEAMRANCPVVLSNASCFPEIAGEAGLYFNPENGLELSEKMSLLLEDSKFRVELLEKGRINFQRFQIEIFKTKMLDLYNSVL